MNTLLPFYNRGWQLAENPHKTAHKTYGGYQLLNKYIWLAGQKLENFFLATIWQTI